MDLYGITLVPLAEEIWATHPAQMSAQLLQLLMDRGTYQGYFPEPTKSLFIVDMPE